jgi:hypothetical protein
MRGAAVPSGQGSAICGGADDRFEELYDRVNGDSKFEPSVGFDDADSSRVAGR